MGSAILVNGERRMLAVSRGTPTSIALGADGGLSVVWPQATARDGDLQRVVTAWLWRLARRELPIRLRELAAEHGLTIKDVSVRNQRTQVGLVRDDRADFAQLAAGTGSGSRARIRARP